MHLEINEIFASIQGEGHWTGLPVVFLRLQGCNLDPPCAYCDTPSAIPLERSCGDITRLDVEDVLELIMGYAPATVVVTGGEPMIQSHALSQLIELDAGKHKWHLETNGTLPVPPPFDWITVSPKFTHVMHPHAPRWADELKVIITKPEDLLRAKDIYLKIQQYPRLKHIWLQPVSNDPDMISLCIEALTGTTDIQQVMGLSIQVHKLIGVR